MNLPGKIILFLALLATTAHAEQWVCQNGNYLVKKEGDGTVLGICGNNNSNILVNCIEATKQEYDNAGTAYKKLDKSVVTGNRIVDMTQTEKDAIVLAESTAQAQAEAVRLVSLDDSIANVDILGTKLQKVETVIDNIGSLNDAKKFLKRLVRYIADKRQ